MKKKKLHFIREVKIIDGKYNFFTICGLIKIRYIDFIFITSMEEYVDCKNCKKIIAKKLLNEVKNADTSSANDV
jgi:hypothetical protein